MTATNRTTWRAAEAISVCQPPALSRGGYLLLDPGAFRDAGDLTPLNGRVCVPTNWSRDFTGLPMLVDLNQCEAPQTAWLESIVSEDHETQRRVPLSQPRVCACLTASGSMDAIASHLAQQMLVLPTDKSGNRSGRGALWRFFDPRVFANLCGLLDPVRLATLTGPVSTWVFPWFGEWFELDTPSDSASLFDMNTREPVAGFTPVDIDVWERAQRIALINQVLAQLALPPGLSWWQRASLAMRIEPALAMAKQRLCWNQPEDQMQYAGHVVRCGSAFLNHPRLAPYWALRDGQNTSGSWADLANLLTTEEYELLAQQAVNITPTLPPADISNTGTLGT